MTTKTTTIETGTAATYQIGSDFYGYTVARVVSGKTVDLVRGSETMRVSLRQDGAWRPTGKHYGLVTFGEAIEHRDPSF